MRPLAYKDLTEAEIILLNAGGWAFDNNGFWSHHTLDDCKTKFTGKRALDVEQVRLQAKLACTAETAKPKELSEPVKDEEKISLSYVIIPSTLPPEGHLYLFIEGKIHGATDGCYCPKCNSPLSKAVEEPEATIMCEECGLTAKMDFFCYTTGDYKLVREEKKSVPDEVESDGLTLGPVEIVDQIQTLTERVNVQRRWLQNIDKQLVSIRTNGVGFKHDVNKRIGSLNEAINEQAERQMNVDNLLRNIADMITDSEDVLPDGDKDNDPQEGKKKGQ